MKKILANKKSNNDENKKTEIASATNKKKEEEEDSTETEGDESDSVIPDFKEATKVVKNNDSNEINTGEKLKSDVVAVCGDDNKVLSSISLKLKSEPKPSSSSTPSLLDSSFTSLARSSSLVPVTATPVTTQSTTSTSTTPLVITSEKQKKKESILPAKEILPSPSISQLSRSNNNIIPTIPSSSSTSAVSNSKTVSSSPNSASVASKPITSKNPNSKGKNKAVTNEDYTFSAADIIDENIAKSISSSLSTVNSLRLHHQISSLCFTYLGGQWGCIGTTTLYATLSHDENKDKEKLSGSSTDKKKEVVEDDIDKGKTGDDNTFLKGEEKNKIISNDGEKEEGEEEEENRGKEMKKQQLRKRMVGVVALHLRGGEGMRINDVSIAAIQPTRKSTNHGYKAEENDCQNNRDHIKNSSVSPLEKCDSNSSSISDDNNKNTKEKENNDDCNDEMMIVEVNDNINDNTNAKPDLNNSNNENDEKITDRTERIEITSNNDYHNKDGNEIKGENGTTNEKIVAQSPLSTAMIEDNVAATDQIQEQKNKINRDNEKMSTSSGVSCSDAEEREKGYDLCTLPVLQVSHVDPSSKILTAPSRKFSPMDCIRGTKMSTTGIRQKQQRYDSDNYDCDYYDDDCANNTKNQNVETKRRYEADTQCSRDGKGMADALRKLVIIQKFLHTWS